MRILVRVLLVLSALLALGVGALAVALPRIVKSDAVRARIEGAAEQALGRKVRFAALDFALLPPSLVVRKPSVAGAADSDPPLAEAEEVALRVALAPLLARSVVVDSLVVEGARRRLVRTARGLVLPPPPATPAAPAGTEAKPAEGPGVALAVRRLALRDTRFVLEDRSVSPAVTWELRDLDADARGESLEAPIAFEAKAALASGGGLQLRGTATLGGELDAELELDGVDLAPLRPYLKQAGELAGDLSGTLRASGPAAEPSAIGAELSLRDGRVALGEVALRGPLSLKADLTGGLGAPQGPFEVDASEAELRYGEAFHKPAGRAATLQGRLVTRPDGSLGVDGAALGLHDLRAQLSLTGGRRTRVEARIEPFELAGWEELLPALEGYGLSGRLAPGEVRLATSPLEVHATLPLDGLRAQHPEAGPVELRGTLEARGDVVETRDLRLLAAEQTVEIAARLSELGGTPRFQVETRTEQADTNRLVSAFTSRRDTFFGLLDLDGNLSGRLGDSLVRSLQGSTRLDVRDGRIAGLSLLEATFEAIAGKGAGGLAAVGVNVASAFTGKDLSRFYAEDFESLTGTLRLADGVASTDDLRLVYGDYSVDLAGDLGLEDGGYRMRGFLTLGPEVDAALASQLGGEAPASKEPPVIPIAAEGDLGEPFGLRQRNPRLVVTSEVAQTLVSRYVVDRYRDKIDDALGAGASDAVRDVLDILGGPKKKE